MKHNDLMDYTNKIYSHTIKDSTEKVLSILNNKRVMGTRMKDNTHNIIEATTKRIFIYC